MFLRVCVPLYFLSVLCSSMFSFHRMFPHVYFSSRLCSLMCVFHRVYVSSCVFFIASVFTHVCFSSCLCSLMCIFQRVYVHSCVFFIVSMFTHVHFSACLCSLMCIFQRVYVHSRVFFSMSMFTQTFSSPSWSCSTVHFFFMCTPSVYFQSRLRSPVCIFHRVCLLCVFSTASVSLCTAVLAWWLRRPPRERKIRGSNPACGVE